MSSSPRTHALVSKQTQETVDLDPDLWTRGLALRQRDEVVALAVTLERELEEARTELKRTEESGIEGANDR